MNCLKQVPKGAAVRYCLLKHQPVMLYFNKLIVSIVNDEIIIIRAITPNSNVNIIRTAATIRANAN